MYDIEPVYVTVKGWLKDTSKIRKYEDLPKETKEYIELIENYTGVKVKYIGVGPAREDIIIK